MRGVTVYRQPAILTFQTKFGSHFNIVLYREVGWRRLCFGEIYERTIICTTITITQDESEQRWLRFVDKMMAVE